MKKLLLTFGFILPVIIGIAQTNLVPNPQFEIARPSTTDYTYYNPQVEKYETPCATNLFRNSLCKNWTIWLGGTTNRSGIILETVKAASNCVPPWPNYVMGNMMHVKTTVGGSGIVNSDITGGSSKVKITCWVYVVKGVVRMSYGPTGSGVVTTTSTSLCKWEKLEITKTGNQACNQVTIYSDNKSDAEFYVDAVSIIKL